MVVIEDQEESILVLPQHSEQRKPLRSTASGWPYPGLFNNVNTQPDRSTQLICKREEKRKTERVPGDESSLTPSPPLKGHGGQTYSSTSSLFNSKPRLLLCLVTVLLFPGEGMCAMMGNMSLCDGLKVPQGEVGIKCPLPTDRNRSVVVKHFVGTNVEDVLDCGWYPQGFSCAKSSLNATLIGNRPGCFLFSLPEDTLQRNGTYRRQLVPPEPQAFTDCYVIDLDDAKGSDGHTALIAAVISIIVVILLVVIVVCYKKRTHEHTTERTHKWALLKRFLPHSLSLRQEERN